jgi:hypothetical protein
LKTLSILSCLLIAISGYSQNITYKDLIGIWVVIDTAVTNKGYVFVYEFLDSTHLNWYGRINQNSDKEHMPPMRYTIKSVHGLQNILINETGDFSNYHSGEYHEFSLKSDTLIIYSFYFPLSESQKLDTITLFKKR